MCGSNGHFVSDIAWCWLEFEEGFFLMVWRLVVACAYPVLMIDDTHTRSMHFIYQGFLGEATALWPYIQ
jgi:hypothetical protein